MEFDGTLVNSEVSRDLFVKFAADDLHEDFALTMREGAESGLQALKFCTLLLLENIPGQRPVYCFKKFLL